MSEPHINGTAMRAIYGICIIYYIMCIYAAEEIGDKFRQVEFVERSIENATDEELITGNIFIL